MTLDLDPDEELALVAELRRIIRDDRYPLSQRIRTLRAILDKLVPPPKIYVPPRTTLRRRRR